MNSTLAKPIAPKRRDALPDPVRVRAAKVKLLEAGEKATDWARRNGESIATVQKVLTGSRPCTKGDAQRVAEKLGIIDA